MKKDYLKSMRDELVEFSNTCEKYYSGEISMPQYKSISGGFGTYSERGHKTGMLRLRITAGDLTKEKFLKLLQNSRHLQTTLVLLLQNTNFQALPQ